MAAENKIHCVRGGNDGKCVVKPPDFIKARILWPALGFPEVVEPEHSFSLLLLSEKSGLTSQDIAKYLRYVAWENRTCRDCLGLGGIRDNEKKQGGFSSDEIQIKKIEAKDEDKYVQTLEFAHLAKFVRDFYKKHGLPHLYQIEIQTEADHLPAGHYNLFWINDSSHDPKISTELKFLKDYFVIGRKAEGEWYKGKMNGPPEGEYMSEYGTSPWTAPFVEVLHPLFVWKRKSELKIAHLADPHICVRADLFEKQIKKGIGYGYKKGQYNNYNHNVAWAVKKANAENCDMLVWSGDLIDFGRGHNGSSSLRDDKAYLLDRNWFVFYKLIAGDDSYQKPMYTVLGNHDWRVHPYGPINRFFSIAADMNLTTEQTRQIHCIDDKNLSPGENAQVKKKDRAAAEKVWYTGSKEGLVPIIATHPLVTHIDAIKWYLLLINPFLDYMSKLPGGYGVLGLDWAEEEDILDGYYPDILTGLPLAENSLTDLQVEFIKQFLARTDFSAKIVWLHAPIVSPTPDMRDCDMQQALIICPECEGKGVLRDGSACRCNELSQTKTGDGPWRPTHPGKLSFTLGSEDTAHYSDSKPNHGTISCHRSWLVKEFGKNRVSLILSGHVHRNTAFRLENAGLADDPRILLVKDHEIKQRGQDPKYPGTQETYNGPLYVNTTSIGPVGDFNETGIKKRIKPAFKIIKVDYTGQISENWIHYEKDLPLLWESPELKANKINIIVDSVLVHNDMDWFGAGEIFFQGDVDGKQTARSDVFEVDSSAKKPVALPKRQWTFEIDVVNRSKSIDISLAAWDKDLTGNEYLGVVTLTLEAPAWDIGAHTKKCAAFSVNFLVEGFTRSGDDFAIV